MRSLFTLCAVFAMIGGHVLAAAPRPNIVFIITDDQGYGDLGHTGNPVIKTPHLDRLAAESSNLTDYHVAPTCSPGRSILARLRDPGAGPVHDAFFYYRDEQLYAVRMGPWKAHFITQSAYPDNERVEHAVPQLYHLDYDPSERHDVSARHPEVILDIRREVERHQATLVRVPSRLDARIEPAVPR